MKRLILTALFLCLCSTADAALTTIGTAQYYGFSYSLIWDDDNNGNSIVWLDLNYSPTSWSDAMPWASNLNGPGVLTYNIDSAYSVDWGTNQWRLPTTSYDGGVYNTATYDGSTPRGYNVTSSELGHLFYAELNNTGLYDTNGNYIYSPSTFGPFQHLYGYFYWSETEYDTGSSTDYAWSFDMGLGEQRMWNKTNSAYKFAMAVRTTTVTSSSVPVPGTIGLLAFGLLGLAGVGRKRK